MVITSKDVQPEPAQNPVDISKGSDDGEDLRKDQDPENPIPTADERVSLDPKAKGKFKPAGAKH